MDREVVAQKLESLRLKKAVGFRNIAVHNYDAIDWEIVHSIAKNNLSDFVEFAKLVATTIDA